MSHLKYFWVWKYYSQHFADGNNFVPYVTPIHRQVSSWKGTSQRKIDLQAILRSASDKLKLYLGFLIVKNWKNWHFSPNFFTFCKNLWFPICIKNTRRVYYQNREFRWTTTNLGNLSKPKNIQFLLFLTQFCPKRGRIWFNF